MYYVISKDSEVLYANYAADIQLVFFSDLIENSYLD